jgi:nucleoside-diphosphate-sugar epimerase
MSRALLVTGADSFIGAAFIRRWLAASDIPVVATYRNSQTRRVDDFSGKLRYVHCDLADLATVDRLFADFAFETIVHAAGARPAGNAPLSASAATRDMIQTTAALLDAAARQDCTRFVFTSAIGVYDGVAQPADGFLEDIALAPSSIFGWSKLAAENLMQLYASGAMKLVTLRLPGVHGWGKNQGVVYAMLQRALRDAPLAINEPQSRFRLLFIDDAVDAMMLAISHVPPASYTCYNIAGDEIITLPQLAAAVISVTGSKSLVNTGENAPVRHQVLNTDLARRSLGFAPRPMREHLAAYRDRLAGDLDDASQKKPS